MDADTNNLVEIETGIYRLKNTFCKPEFISIDGLKYTRFMDYFYLCESTQSLDKEKVISLCREREKLANYGEANRSVKKAINNFVSKYKSGNILEVGAGTSPTLIFTPPNDKYVLADIDPHVVKENASKGLVSTLFSSQDDLSYPDAYFQIGFAVFVFHFKIYDTQIRELKRCLNRDGCFIANVYLINDEEREFLANSIKSHDFNLVRLQDPLNSCKSHEYWIFGASESATAKAMTILEGILSQT